MPALLELLLVLMELDAVIVQKDIILIHMALVGAILVVLDIILIRLVQPDVKNALMDMILIEVLLSAVFFSVYFAYKKIIFNLFLEKILIINKEIKLIK